MFIFHHIINYTNELILYCFQLQLKPQNTVSQQRQLLLSFSPFCLSTNQKNKSMKFLSVFSSKTQDNENELEGRCRRYINGLYKFKLLYFCMGRQAATNCKKSRRNAKISLNKRKKLIYFVIEKSYSIGKASSRLKIKLSTAKIIVKRFKTDGTYFEPKIANQKCSSLDKESHPPSNVNFVKMENQEVKVEPAEAPKSDTVIKVEEKEEPTLNSSAELPFEPAMASWKVFFGEYPYFYDGYMIQSYPGLLQPLYLA